MYKPKSYNQKGKIMNIAFFPGKFQPPHIGHVITIAKLRKQYQVIIGVTEDPPRVISPMEVCKIFKTIFDIECIILKGTLTKYNNITSLPKFDILLTGNDKVIEWAQLLNIPVLKVPRSDGILCSGTELREAMKCRK